MRVTLFPLAELKRCIKDIRGFFVFLGISFSGTLLLFSDKLFLFVSKQFTWTGNSRQFLLFIFMAVIFLVLDWWIVRWTVEPKYIAKQDIKMASSLLFISAILAIVTALALRLYIEGKQLPTLALEGTPSTTSVPRLSLSLSSIPAIAIISLTSFTLFSSIYKWVSPTVQKIDYSDFHAAMKGLSQLIIPYPIPDMQKRANHYRAYTQEYIRYLKVICENLEKNARFDKDAVEHLEKFKPLLELFQKVEKGQVYEGIDELRDWESLGFHNIPRPVWETWRRVQIGGD